MNKIPHTIIETESYLEVVSKLWSEDEQDEFKWYIASNVLAGDLIPGTGGIRKIRWSRPGMGKCGGVRVVYYYYNDTAPIYLLFAYTKGKQENLTEDEKKSLRIFIEILKKQLKT